MRLINEIEILSCHATSNGCGCECLVLKKLSVHTIIHAIVSKKVHLLSAHLTTSICLMFMRFKDEDINDTSFGKSSCGTRNGKLCSGWLEHSFANCIELPPWSHQLSALGEQCSVLSF